MVVETEGLSTVHISPPPFFGRRPSGSRYRTFYRSVSTNGETEYVRVVHKVGSNSPKIKTGMREAYAEVAVGGSLVKIKPSIAYGVAGSGGKTSARRGMVTSFSSAARKRLMRTIAATERRNRPLFVTMTYPGDFPDDANKWRRDLDVFGKRFVRAFDGGSFVWRMEFKERKTGDSKGLLAPHFHLLVWGVGLKKFRRWGDSSWYGVVGSGDVDHLRAGVSSEHIRTWRGTMSYVSKYLAKTDDMPPLWNGRLWGVISRKNIPWAIVIRIPLGEGAAVRAVRVARKFMRLTGKTLVWGVAWIVNAERFLDYLEAEQAYW